MGCLRKYRGIWIAIVNPPRLALAGELHAAQTLDAYLDVFSDHYLGAKHQRAMDWGDAVHLSLQALGK